jgi:capsular polysaccharide biosynthesis protein
MFGITKRTRQLKPPVPKSKSARFGGIFSHPIRFLRWTGCLKYRPISYEQFNPVPYDGQALFAAAKPSCAIASLPWTASQAIDMVMSHTVALEDAMATCYGYVFDKKGRLIAGATHKFRERRMYPRWIKRGPLVQPHPIFPRIEHYRETIAVLTASTQGIYFHWLLDILPRLGMLSKTGAEVDLIYIQRKHRFQKESLEMLGIDARQIISTNDVAVLTAGKIVVPCHQIMNGREIPPWVIQYLRDQFLPTAAKTARPENRRIYISRKSADRRLENESEIISHLIHYGFSLVELEKLSFREQIQLFREARVVISPHGSGLANLVFSSPGTKVIELFPVANLDLFYRLSTALKLNYFYVKAKKGHPTQLVRNDYTIHWEDLKKTLDMAAILPRHPC